MFTVLLGKNSFYFFAIKTQKFDQTNANRDE